MEKTCGRVIPGWMVALDNAPTAIMHILGIAIVMRAGPVAGVVYALYALSTYFWFWLRICPWCALHGTKGCPCGYGALSSRLTGGRGAAGFRKRFRRNLPYLFPAWFLPFGLGLWQLVADYSPAYLGILAAFSAIGFLVVPFISRLLACRACPSRGQCPWMDEKGSKGGCEELSA